MEKPKIDRNTAMYLRGGSTQILKEGYPLSAFWSYSFAGLDGSNGKPMFNYVEVPDEEKSKSIESDYLLGIFREKQSRTSPEVSVLVSVTNLCH